jgi:epoxyqueuosine reductase
MAEKNKPKLLLHICCAGCGAYVGQKLSEDYEVSLYYYNPNIDTEFEYGLREIEVRKVSAFLRSDMIWETYNHGNWLSLMRGLENEPEKGLRCEKCFQERLEKTAIKARELGFSHFASTLTVSPHKNAAQIMAIGKCLSEKYRLDFLAVDFKKNSGFQSSVQLSAQLGLKRQNYCGCEFSRRR